LLALKQQLEQQERFSNDDDNASGGIFLVLRVVLLETLPFLVVVVFETFFEDETVKDVYDALLFLLHLK
jgi:hypothetical protein